MQVMDFDRFSSDDPIGEVMVGQIWKSILLTSPLVANEERQIRKEPCLLETPSASNYKQSKN